MAGDTVSLVRPKAVRPPPVEEPALAAWPVTAVARVLTALRPNAAEPDAVQRKAIALGLLRQPEAGLPAVLTARALSRLFLAGYQLPAHVLPSSFNSVREHIRAGRRVFCLSAAGHALEVTAEQDGPGCVPMDELERTWDAASAGLVAAARQWADLPRDGSRFFAGHRGRDGVCHWETAGCDTDEAGRILRFWRDDG